MVVFTYMSDNKQNKNSKFKMKYSVMLISQKIINNCIWKIQSHKYDKRLLQLRNKFHDKFKSSRDLELNIYKVMFSILKIKKSL